MRIVTAGASIGGLSAALALARAGHEIALVERDPLVTNAGPHSAFQWTRNGIPHFQQPHAFLPRGRLIVLREFPDVYETLLNAGALDYARTLNEIPSDLDAQTRSYFSRIEPEIRERFAMSRDFDDARNEMWKGAKLDFSKRTGCYPLFAEIAAAAVAVQDPEVCRKWLRRATFLDRAAAFDDDPELQERVEILFSKMLKSGPPPKTRPDREMLLDCMRAAVRN
jgi:glycine/D-amino acid oxidase-like deaminating enzyme